MGEVERRRRGDRSDESGVEWERGGGGESRVRFLEEEEEEEEEEEWEVPLALRGEVIGDGCVRERWEEQWKKRRMSEPHSAGDGHASSRRSGMQLCYAL